MIKLFVILTVIALIIAVIGHIMGKLRKTVLIVNAVLGALLVTAVGLFLCSEAVYSAGSRKYHVSRGGLLGGIYYSETLDGYYIIHEDALFSSDYLAIPAESAELPRITKAYTPIMIFRTKEGSDRGGDVTIKGHIYRLYYGVVDIVPDFAALSITLFVSGLLAAFVFNFIAFVAAAVIDWKRRDSDEL